MNRPLEDREESDLLYLKMVKSKSIIIQKDIKDVVLDLN